jgi:perosamine synthetase
MASENNDFINLAEPLLTGNELAYVTDCIQSGWISSLGKYVPRFEEMFAEFCGTRFALSTSNGTVAIHLALETLGIGPGDEVIIPSLTFIATANAVCYTGATPVFVDSERETWNLDPEDVARKITPRTRAIVPVHVYGHPAKMDEILMLGEKYKLHIIEDAAEAHGALYKGKRVGSFGELNTFSFYGNKIVTTGEGGMLTTNDEKLARKARFLHDHAMSPEKRYWHTVVGYNYRLTNIQAAIGVAQMERIEEFIARKRHIAALYNQLLAGTRGIILPPAAEWATSVYWMYSVLLTDEFPLERDELMAYLRQKNIDSRPFFYPIHTMPSYHTGESLPVAEDLSKRGINLPSAVTLTDAQIERITTAIKSLIK